MKSLASELKPLFPKPKFPARLGGKNGWAVPNWNRRFLIDSKAERFMYLRMSVKRGVGVNNNNELYLHEHTKTYSIAKAIFRNQNYNRGHAITLLWL